ncbi:hypothetical protein OF83DRAFT_1172968 [Amylostereum chailletii]|nr:hypothetical protein OF83DRAFT_1172968 [Amylostereum chailletii]
MLGADVSVEGHDEETRMLKCDLREVCVELARVVPAVFEDYDELLALNKAMFEGLVAIPSAA